MEQINSIKDPRVVEARQLNKVAIDKKLFLLEGEDIIKWALDNNVVIKHVFINAKYTNNVLLNRLSQQHIFIYSVSDGIIKKINDSKYLTPIIGVANIPQNNKINSPDMILMLEDLQDHGNIGSIIRTSCAFGIDNIITTGRSSNIYNKKTIIASRGTAFKIKHEHQNDGIVTIKRLQDKGYQIIATSPHGEKIHSLLRLEKRPVILVIGNETNGVSDALLQHADVTIQIPMSSAVESINVSVATGISLYELKLKVIIAMLARKIHETIGREISVLHKMVQEVFDLELKKICLYTSQQVILLMIMVCDETMTLKDIEKDTSCHGAELNFLLQPLLQENLIICNNEGSYSVTSYGKELIAKLWDVEQAVEEKVLSVLSSEEKKLFKEFIDRIIQNYERLAS
jgi:RNA methyltransferase, TrmH family